MKERIVHDEIALAHEVVDSTSKKNVLTWIYRSTPLDFLEFSSIWFDGVRIPSKMGGTNYATRYHGVLFYAYKWEGRYQFWLELRVDKEIHYLLVFSYWRCR